jgi:uncharacterized membrane protein YebE (DUF533 family)/DNA-binding MarR family transcriptional regulator
MVDGFLGSLTTEQRMLIHLYDNILPSNQWEAPVALTQAGISAAVHVQRKHVPRTLKRLEKSNEIEVTNRHVPGGRQRRKVYSLTTQGKIRGKLVVENVLSTIIEFDGEPTAIADISKNNRRILEILSHIDSNMRYHDEPVITSIAKPSGKASLDAQSSEELMKRMFARAWEDGKITNDEHQLITEVVDFLGMHPERVRRLSEEARTAIDIPPPEEIYLEMLRQALVDEQIIEEENALLETFRVAYGINGEMHANLLEKALLEPMYPEHIITYYSALETAMDDGIITGDEDAMLNTLRKSLDITDGEHANLLAKIRDSIK